MQLHKGCGARLLLASSVHSYFPHATEGPMLKQHAHVGKCKQAWHDRLSPPLAPPMHVSRAPQFIHRAQA